MIASHKNLPDTQIAINDLIVLFSADRHTEFETNAKMFLEQFPDVGIIWKLLGASLRAQKKDSIIAGLQAHKLLPNDSEVLNNLGNAYRDIGQFQSAVNCFLHAIKINPMFATAYCNLGNVAKDMGHMNDAVTCFLRAVEIQPEYSYAYNDLAHVLALCGKNNEAINAYSRAIASNPNYYAAYSNLGMVYIDLDQLENAIICFDRALEINPSFAKGHNNLGVALQHNGQLELATSSFRKAIDLDPLYAEAHSNLGVVLKDMGQFDNALKCYQIALKIDPTSIEANSNLLFIHNYLSGQSTDVLLGYARRFGREVSKKAKPYTIWSNAKDPDRRLRVGFISADLHTHPVGYFIVNAFSAIKSNEGFGIDLFAYSNNFIQDDTTKRIMSCCSGWCSVMGMSDEILARKIYDDSIDILIDLSGHTAKNRLPVFSWKPAPVQASWLGYFATTGVSEIDYFISDKWMAPNYIDSHFVEKIHRLPETFLCFTEPSVDVEIGELPAITNDYITFGCFNNLAKINDEVIAVWAEILCSISGSKLILKAKQLKDDAMREKIVSRFYEYGVAGSRITMEGYSSRAQYLNDYNRVDIALDPFPYPGGTTTVESLWMGVPVLTMTGEQYISHQGESIMRNVGLVEFITFNRNDYVSRAIEISKDLRRLAVLRSGLREKLKASPLCNGSRFALNFTSALREMWSHWCNTQNE